MMTKGGDKNRVKDTPEKPNVGGLCETSGRSQTAGSIGIRVHMQFRMGGILFLLIFRFVFVDRCCNYSWPKLVNRIER